MIRFDHVSKSYKGTPRPALDDITTEILRGEFVFVVGASGSGKSTFLRLILREEKVTRGKLHVLGQNLSNISNRKVPYFRRNVGVVFQDFRLLTNKTVFDNVAFTLKVIGKSNGYIHEAVPDVLAMVGLDGKAQRFPHELSGGEQQRVAIARAVVNKPQVLLADEPTGNLDPATSAGITAVLERINASGTTVIMATHEAGLVDRLQKRVIELVNGTMIRDERHGGYGFTAATPILDARDRDDATPAVGASIIDEPPAPVVVPATKRAADADKGQRTKHEGRKAGKRAAKAQAQAAAAPVVVPSAAAAQSPEPQRPVVPDPVSARSAAGGEATTVPSTRGAPPAARPVSSPITASTPAVFPTAEPATRSEDDLRPAAVPAASATEPANDEAPSLLDQVRVPDAGAVDELSLAERLGLRSGRHDHDDDSNQDVGPVS